MGGQAPPAVLPGLPQAPDSATSALVAPSAEVGMKNAPQPYASRAGQHGGKRFGFDVARGTFSDLKAVNKFGRTTNADDGVATDVWDGEGVRVAELEQQGIV